MPSRKTLSDTSTHPSDEQKKELGPYAFEERMPSALLARLTNEDDSNKLNGVIHQLAKLLQADETIASAYICTVIAIQVSKIPGEGNVFCGYRNVQMLVSCLPSISFQGTIDSSTIPAIQRQIESAWMKGFNPHGRVQTGGILNTRKYIGTPEVEALLLSSGIEHRAQGFYGPDAHEQLLDYVEEYFSSSASEETGPHDDGAASVRVKRTSRPPIYLQRPRHSLTIIGVIRHHSGKRHLLVFDPAWNPPSAMRKTVTASAGATPAIEYSSCSIWPASWRREYVLRRYRKSERYLRRYDAFEVVHVCSPTNGGAMASSEG
ncbi:Zinc finger with UFM1-specific peptidase domain protein [Cyphellophora attinorum]|uniref:Zinc finger with UFM1-specific peptidase domain protein n=1 Tax=Cyphellophora attinorum TaxID=1664694 RepID=A0A0N1GZ10_9EURO|nr:Zinc finger with UFM1-specific peptidase domain protein [Phialophora attinorum]KPI36222.1 Zinc finger with UFM1-specific peptidase domain protein [Phialophora attinorum]